MGGRPRRWSGKCLGRRWPRSRKCCGRGGNSSGKARVARECKGSIDCVTGPLRAPVISLRVCDFFEVAKTRCCKQNSYDDKIVENSKKSQTLRMTDGRELDDFKGSPSGFSFSLTISSWCPSRQEPLPENVGRGQRRQTCCRCARR